MNAPVNFQFAHGGILGYAGDEDQGSRVRSRLPNESFEEYRQRIIALEEADAARADAVARARQEAERQQMMASRQASGQMLPRNPLLGTPAAQRPPAPGPVTPQAPPPQGQGQGLPDAMGPAGQAALKYATEPTQAASLPATIAEHRALQKEFGTDKPMGVEEREYWKRQDELQKRREAQAKDVAWSSYVEGLKGTPGSGAARYDESMARSLGQSADFQGQRYKDLASLNTAQRAAAEKQQTEAGTAFGAAKTASAAERLGKAGIGERLFSTDAQTASEKMRDLTSRYNADQQNKSQEKIAALSRAMQNSQFNRQGARDAANQLNQMGQRAEADVNNLRAQYAAARKEMDQAEIDRVAPLLENAEAIQRSVVAAIGKSAGVAMPKEAPAAATTRLKFDAQGKPIK
jgi:hypothetical protein